MQHLPERPGVSRVWFYVSVELKEFVPGFVVQLVSKLGLKKASSWVKDLEQPSELQAAAMDAVRAASEPEEAMAEGVEVAPVR